MSASSQRSRLRAWLGTRAGLYSRLVATVGLMAPLLALALARYLEGVPVMNLAGFYAAFVFLGYYVIVLLFLVTVVFALTMFWRGVSVVACSVLVSGALLYLIVDATVYRVYRYHVDAFWLDLALGSFSGIGFSPSLIGIGVGALAFVAGLQWLLFRLAGRLPNRGRLLAGFAALAILSCAASQVIHILAYERNDTRITDLTLRFPFYYPVTSHRHAVRYASALPMIAETPSQLASDRDLTLAYPLAPVHCDSLTAARRPNILMILLESWRADTMNETVTPNIHALAGRSSVFESHYSSGNSTPSGVFSIFYGIHPTYWPAVKANSAAIDNPVLIDALEASGYRFGIFADSHFQRHKIKDGMFRGIEIHESFEGSSADVKDRDLTERLLAFALEANRAGRPFFGFAFYKSTHFSYYYPKGSARFLPASKLNIALASAERDPEAFLNDYKNAVSHVDGLVGDLMAGLEAAGILDDTIVVITSDHGEEFNDNKANYWGHTSNFTGYQTRVPLVIHVPWRDARRVTEATAHIDIPPTLLQEGLGCSHDAGDYSNGRNLFGASPGERPIVISSYVNHAIVANDDVYSVFPMYIQKYKLWDINARADAIPPGLARQAIDEMRRFYRREPSS